MEFEYVGIEIVLEIDTIIQIVNNKIIKKKLLDMTNTSLVNNTFC